MCTFSPSVVPTRLVSNLQFYRSTRRRVPVKNIVRDSAVFRSKPTKDHLVDSCERVQSNNFIRTVSSQVQCHRTHVPSRAALPPITTTIRFCTRLSTNTVSPQSVTNHVAKHVISRTELAPSEYTRPTCKYNEQCPHKFTGFQHQMRMNEIPQLMFYINTHFHFLLSSLRSPLSSLPSFLLSLCSLIFALSSLLLFSCCFVAVLSFDPFLFVSFSGFFVLFSSRCFSLFFVLCSSFRCLFF